MVVLQNRARTDASINPIVPAAVCVAVAGFVTEGVVAFVHHTGEDHWDGLSQLLNGSYALAALALIVVLPALGQWLQVSRLGRAGVVVAQVGYAAMVIESIVSGFHGGNTLGGLFFGGLVLSLVGLLVVGIAGLISGAVRWASMLAALGMFVAIAGGDHGGSILLGAVWAVLGIALLRAE